MGSVEGADEIPSPINQGICSSTEMSHSNDVSLTRSEVDVAEGAIAKAKEVGRAGSSETAQTLTRLFRVFVHKSVGSELYCKRIVDGQYCVMWMSERF